MNTQELYELIRGGETETVEFKRFGAIANRQCQELCGLSRDQATRLLKKLVERGDLKMTDKGRRARYVLPNAQTQGRD